MLYPKIKPFNEFYLSVSNKHTIFVEESGNPKGKPVIFYMVALVEELSQFIDNILTLKNGVLLFLISVDVAKVYLTLNWMKILHGI